MSLGPSRINFDWLQVQQQGLALYATIELFMMFITLKLMFRFQALSPYNQIIMLIAQLFGSASFLSCLFLLIFFFLKNLFFRLILQAFGYMPFVFVKSL